MTLMIVHQYRCDAPDCEATAPAAKHYSILPPASWRLINSASHLPHNDDSGLYLTQLARGDALTKEQRSLGAITLHLCPNHHDVFDRHLPTTDSRPGRGNRAPTATVRCSCGRGFGTTTVARVVGERPALTTERLWWQHLPRALRSYALRQVPR